MEEESTNQLQDLEGSPQGFYQGLLRKKGSNTIKIIVIAIALIILILAIALGFAFMDFDPGEPTPGVGPNGNQSSSLSFPLGINQEETANCIQEYIESKEQGSPFITEVTNVGEKFVLAGAANDVNPALLVAIAGAETTFATTGWAKNHPEAHNYFGMTATSSQPHIVINDRVKARKFDSWEDAISFQAEYIREKYLDQGRTTITLIRQKYAPAGAANDPSGLNDNWITNVTKYFNEIVSKCPTLKPDDMMSEIAQKIVEIARNELHYKPAVNDCATRYGGGCEKWCAKFVSWVYKQAGKDIGMIKSAEGLKNYFSLKRAYLAEPRTVDIKPGDVLILRDNGKSTKSTISHHVGIVTSVIGNKIHTIDGNTGGDDVEAQTYDISVVLGIGQIDKLP